MALGRPFVGVSAAERGRDEIVTIKAPAADAGNESRAPFHCPHCPIAPSPTDFMDYDPRERSSPISPIRVIRQPIE